MKAEEEKEENKVEEEEFLIDVEVSVDEEPDDDRNFEYRTNLSVEKVRNCILCVCVYI